MGIPYFFSYIIKNYKNIITTFVKTPKQTYDNFFLDSNSIIYDIVHNLKEYNGTNINQFIINKVIEKIENYIDLVNPKNIIYIAFDGTPPLSKLEQQRTRRYKSWYSNKVKQQIQSNFSHNKSSHNNNISFQNLFDTIHITSGTVFMNELSLTIREHFKNNNNKVIFSGSDESGEGESKIFEYIRKNPETHLNKNNIIFGLDSDIIILSLNHIHLQKSKEPIYIDLLREVSHFKGVIDGNNIKQNELCLLNINRLSKGIVEELTLHNDFKIEEEDDIIKDYIFLSFFLGNDFIQGHISLNIRTGGFDKVLNAYIATCASSKKYLINNNKIIWKNVYLLISFLEKMEHGFILDEYKLRNKKEKKNYDISREEKMYEKFDEIPNYERYIEKYINPFQDGWQYRYYKSLFDIDINNERRKQMCINFLESLEWTFKYYTNECPDYYWKYNYHYSPLLEDIVKFIPIFDTQFIGENNNKYNTISPLTQLLYVLPVENIKMLYPTIYELLIKKYPEIYEENIYENIEFNWAFKRYFWESIPKIPNIDIYKLEEFVSNDVIL